MRKRKEFFGIWSKNGKIHILRRIKGYYGNGYYAICNPHNLSDIKGEWEITDGKGKNKDLNNQYCSHCRMVKIKDK